MKVIFGLISIFLSLNVLIGHTGGHDTRSTSTSTRIKFVISSDKNPKFSFI